MKLNHLADWSDEEYDSLLGLEHDEFSRDKIPHEPEDDPTLQPIDWVDNQAVTGVRDRSQWYNPYTDRYYGMGSCSSSYATAAAEMLEGYLSIMKGRLVSLSVQQIMDCSSNESIMSKIGDGKSWNYGCAGGYLENALSYSLKYDVFDMKTYQYKGFDAQCKTEGLKPKQRVRLPGFVKPWAYDPTAIKKELKKGPVAASISGSSPIFKFYGLGIIDDLSLSGHNHYICNTGKINHAVLIVGWGRDEIFGKEYFVIKNSFGTDWGEDGFARIAVENNQDNKAGSCGILSAVFSLA